MEEATQFPLSGSGSNLQFMRGDGGHKTRTKSPCGAGIKPADDPKSAECIKNIDDDDALKIIYKYLFFFLLLL